MRVAQHALRAAAGAAHSALARTAAGLAGLWLSPAALYTLPRLAGTAPAPALTGTPLWSFCSQRLVQQIAGGVLHQLKQRCKEVAPGVHPSIEGSKVWGRAQRAGVCIAACGAVCQGMLGPLLPGLGVLSYPSNQAPRRGPLHCWSACLNPHLPSQPQLAAKLLFHPRSQEESEWMVVDAGSVVVHVFLEGWREEYDLEGLWGAPDGSNVRRLAPRQAVQTLHTITA